MEIAVTTIVSMMMLIIEHYLPWELMTGKKLPRLATYILGTLSIAIPLTALGYFWIVNDANSISMVLLALWILVIFDGIAVCATWLIDNALVTRLKLNIRENEANQLRSGLDNGAKKK